MNSGVRVPYHFEVAETQRITQKHEEFFQLEADKQYQLLEEGKITQPQFDKIIEQLDERKNSLLASLSSPTTTTTTATNTAALTPESNKETAGATPTLFASTSKAVKDAQVQSPSETIRKLLDERNKQQVQQQQQQQQQEGSSSSPALQPNTDTHSSIQLTPEESATIPAFVRTPSSPSSLAEFENLRHMPAVPRYDAFYNPPLVPLTPFKFSQRWRYLTYFRVHALALDEFLQVDVDQAVSVATVYRHPHSGTMVTLLPVVHAAHPSFWRQCDDLCCQHHSILMEGRYSPMSSDISVVPPRSPYDDSRPEEDLDAEGWEPPSGEFMKNFRQPYSWGVAESKEHTIIHAADSYDYDKLPVWARLRHNVPFLGGYKREKHCLNILYQLSGNGYESFVIPWGVGHMPIFARMLLENGFHKAGATRVVLFNRVDGPVSAAYVRKLKATLNRGHFFRHIMRTLGGITLAWGGVAFLGWEKADVVMWADDGGKYENRGRDQNSRRAWDKAMEPNVTQQRLRTA